MTQKELRRLSRVELLELLLDQVNLIDRLEAELAQTREELARTREKLEARELRLQEAGSIARAALQITDIFEKAQEAADLYLAGVMALPRTEEKADSENDESATETTMD